MKGKKPRKGIFQNNIFMTDFSESSNEKSLKPSPKK